MKNNSLLMEFLLFFGRKRLAWSFRRLFCPVNKEALVLEVGSGGSPYFRSNVLIDAYESTRERHWAPLITDRPSVLGFGESLPFKDKAFDFVIASHVLEHSSNPELFLKELQRVAKAGYIETPDAFMERLNPYWDHRSEVTLRENQLRIRKKEGWIVDSYLANLYEVKAKKVIAEDTIPNNPFEFHTRYFWQDKIDYIIENSSVSADWEAPNFNQPYTPKITFRGSINGIVLKFIRMLLSQHARNKKIDLTTLLICPNCKSDGLAFGNDLICCLSCSSKYERRHGIPKMFAS